MICSCRLVLFMLVLQTSLDKGSSTITQAKLSDGKVPAQMSVMQGEVFFIARVESVTSKLNAIDMQSQNCTTDEDCKALLPYLDQAMNKDRLDSIIPSEPFCGRTNDTSESKCSCGEGRCVSFTKDWKGTVMYYCGPCSHVGAQCDKKLIPSCQHERAECINGFCHCQDGGEFYEFSYCKIPYYGYEVALQIAIILCIVIAVCLLIATIYSAININRLGTHLAPCSRRSNQHSCHSEVNEVILDDTPPMYDDVVDNLPTYQDALDMKQEDEGYMNPYYETEFFTSMEDRRREDHCRISRQCRRNGELSQAEDTFSDIHVSESQVGYQVFECRSNSTFRDSQHTGTDPLPIFSVLEQSTQL